MQLSTHSGRMERWLGPQAEVLSKAMKDWPAGPIALAGVPGNVWIHGGGDFRGRILSGQMSSATDYAIARAKKMLQRAAHRQMSTLNTGFSGLSDLISEASVGKRREYQFAKSCPGVTTALKSASLWRLGNLPQAGGSPSAGPTNGRQCTSATTGAFTFTNPSSPDTQHFVAGNALCSLVGQFLLYDRLWDVQKLINSTATETISGATALPLRYQSITASAMDYIGGNFLFPEVAATALPATAHNYTAAGNTYLDQANASSQIQLLTRGAVAVSPDELDLNVFQWYMTLDPGDVGIKGLSTMTISALIATGTINMVIGHPLAWFPVPLAGMMCQIDGINTAFNLVRIFDDACLAFLEVIKSVTTANGFVGNMTTVAG